MSTLALPAVQPPTAVQPGGQGAAETAFPVPAPLTQRPVVAPTATEAERRELAAARKRKEPPERSSRAAGRSADEATPTEARTAAVRGSLLDVFA